VDNKPIRILLQTTIVPDANDWSIARFGKLAALLGAQRDAGGMPLYEVVARDRATAEGPDPVLSTIDTSDFDQLWLFAVDVGTGLDAEDCAAIGRFRGNGRGLLVTRDHMDLGSSVCSLGGVGAAHFFHTQHPDPDAARHVIDDPYTTYISWPNYHSGANGDYQAIETVGPVHPVLADAGSPTGAIRYLPAHPHEGGVGAPAGEQARVIARGTSIVTGTSFNIAVAFEPHEGAGPAIAQSTFHHFADYNWDPKSGCPSFVDEPAGSAMAENPQAMRDTERYVLNVAGWLGGAGVS
jgi:hypothetical protein